MKIRNIIDEDFQDYKKTGMLLATCYCDFKCLKEQNLDCSLCQNSTLTNNEILEVDDIFLINRYLQNNITNSLIFGGLEPFLQYEEIYNFIKNFREYTLDDVVIFTGYYYYEIRNKVDELKCFKNIIIKFGRFLINNEQTFDDILGVNLASSNQYAVKVS